MSFPWFVNQSDTVAVHALRLFEPFPAITASLSCWSMAKRVLGRQGTILISDSMMVELERLQNPGSDPANLAAVDMLAYYKLLLDYLTIAPHMAYHTGSIERPPRIELTNATATFTISALHIEQHLPQLFARMQIAPGLNYTAAMDLDWTEHRPLNELLGASETYGTIWMPTAPEDETIQSWLPHGMYRHHDGQSLALFVSNPWGAKHRNVDGNEVAAMNPFAFNYAAPETSAPTIYSYQFTFDPAVYGFKHCYMVAQTIYTKSPHHRLRSPHGVREARCGRAQLSGTAAAFAFHSYIFEPANTGVVEKKMAPRLG
jgi:hypothetical protein